MKIIVDCPSDKIKDSIDEKQINTSSIDWG
jgi:hypothetical protein